MGYGFIVTIIVDLVKSWWLGRKADQTRQACEAASLQIKAQEKDHKDAEEILDKQRNLSPADVDELLKAPNDRLTNKQ